MYKWIDLLPLRQTRRFVFGVPDIGSILEGQLTGNCLLLGVGEGRGDTLFASKHRNSRPCGNRWQQGQAPGPGYHGKSKAPAASSC